MKIIRISARRMLVDHETGSERAIEITAEIDEEDDPGLALYNLKQRVDDEAMIYGTETAPPEPSVKIMIEKERHPDMRFRYGICESGKTKWGTPEDPCVDEDDIPF